MDVQNHPNYKKLKDSEARVPSTGSEYVNIYESIRGRWDSIGARIGVKNVDLTVIRQSLYHPTESRKACEMLSVARTEKAKNRKPFLLTDLIDAMLEEGLFSEVLAILKIPDSSESIDVKSVQQSRHESAPALDTKLSPPPEKLRDAIIHPDFQSMFSKIFLKLNETNSQNLTGWQTIMNQFLTVEFPQTLKMNIFSKQSKNPSEEVVVYIAQNTIITLHRFCDVLRSQQIDLGKYADQLVGIYEKCMEKFKSMSEKVNANKSEIYCWCNQKDLAFLIPTLEANGFSALEDIADITEQDLQTLGIDKMGQRKQIMRAISTLKLNSNN